MVPLNIDWQQILLHLFNFVVLFAVLYFLLYNPVKKFMESREEHYKKLDDDAKRNLEESESVKSEYDNKLKNANTEIAQLKEKAYKDAEQMKQNKVDETKALTDKMLNDAKETIENERRKILSEAQAEISQMVTDAVGKVVSEESTGEAYERFFDAVKGGLNDSE